MCQSVGFRIDSRYTTGTNCWASGEALGNDITASYSAVFIHRTPYDPFNLV